jgi:hypothetical protein
MHFSSSAFQGATASRLSRDRAFGERAGPCCCNGADVSQHGDLQRAYGVVKLESSSHIFFKQIAVPQRTLTIDAGTAPHLVRRIDNPCAAMHASHERQNPKHGRDTFASGTQFSRTQFRKK